MLHYIRSVLFSLLTCLVIALPLIHGALANEAGAATEAQSESAEEKILIPEFQQTPRAAMSHFLAVMERAKQDELSDLSEAIQILDLSDVNPLIRTERGTELAWTLLNVLERGGLTATKRISKRTAGDPVEIGTFEAGPILLSHSENFGWRFDKESLGKLPDFLDELSAAEKGQPENRAAQISETYLPLSVRIRQAVPQNPKAENVRAGTLAMAGDPDHDFGRLRPRQIRLTPVAPYGPHVERPNAEPRLSRCRQRYSETAWFNGDGHRLVGRLESNGPTGSCPCSVTNLGQISDLFIRSMGCLPFSRFVARFFARQSASNSKQAR